MKSPATIPCREDWLTGTIATLATGLSNTGLSVGVAFSHLFAPIKHPQVSAKGDTE
jgi:hypothetical protein